ncbi:MAG: hypothetical protein H7238_06625 [Polaromonas sp.]|nr:hypothetical protein [Polaromonas sp.]
MREQASLVFSSLDRAAALDIGRHGVLYRQGLRGFFLPDLQLHYWQQHFARIIQRIGNECRHRCARVEKLIFKRLNRSEIPAQQLLRFPTDFVTTKLGFLPWQLAQQLAENRTRLGRFGVFNGRH